MVHGPEPMLALKGIYGIQLSTDERLLSLLPSVKLFERLWNMDKGYYGECLPVGVFSSDK